MKRSLSPRLPVIFSLLTACAPSHGAAYDRAFAEAARAESAGRLAEAVADFDRAAASAIRQRDRDQARWGAAQVMERSGPMAAALARLEAIAADGTSEHQPEAAYRAAVLRIDHGDTDRGWADLERVPRRFPSSGVGHVAVRRLVAHADEKGPEGAFAELHALAHDLAGTELEELVAFSTAQHLEARGDDDAARGAYVHIADRWPYPYGAFFDDALWRASLLDEKLGRYQVAVDELERMVAQRETTTLVGSYERAKYVPAMLRIGELYRDRLHDHARARDAFHRLYAGFAHSTRRDDALWLEADLWRQDGDAGKACDRLATLVQDFPDSRYVPCATGQCAGLERPAGSGAPKECRPYITREGWEPKAE